MSKNDNLSHEQAIVWLKHKEQGLIRALKEYRYDIRKLKVHSKNDYIFMMNMYSNAKYTIGVLRNVRFSIKILQS